jgi:hypothetical protein
VWRADCQLRASRWQLVLGLLAHMLAAVAVVLAYAPLPVKLACLPVIALLAWRSLPRYRLHGADSVVALREYGTDWWLETADGAGRRAVLQPGALLWRYLLVLRFAEAGATGKPALWSVAVFPDSLPADDFRRLYVRLRWRRHSPAAAELDS